MTCSARSSMAAARRRWWPAATPAAGPCGPRSRPPATTTEYVNGLARTDAGPRVRAGRRDRYDLPSQTPETSQTPQASPAFAQPKIPQQADLAAVVRDLVQGVQREL